MSSSPATAAHDHPEHAVLRAVAAVDVAADVLPAVLERADAEVPALLAALAAVPDPRHARGVRHQLLKVLACACCAVLSGSRSYVAIAEWTADLGERVLTALDGDGDRDGGCARRVPCESTLRRCLQAVDPPALEAAVCGWLSARVTAARHLDPSRRLLPTAEARRVIAIDGKTLRGSAARGSAGADAVAATGGGRVHLLAALDHETGVVFAERACDQATGKGGEVAAGAALLADLDQRGLLTGAVVTVDALHTQRAHAELLHTAGAHYIFTVKGNQPRLLARCKALNWADVPEGARIRDAGHGRRETRTLRVLSLDPIPDRGTHGDADFFPHAAQVLKLTRRRRSTRGRWHTETVYAITSLSARQAHPALLAAWVRGHWGIENRLHWVRDTAFDEDHSQVRTAHGPQVMAALRNLAISVLRVEGWENIAAGLRKHARQPDLPLLTYGLT